MSEQAGYLIAGNYIGGNQFITKARFTPDTQGSARIECAPPSCEMCGCKMNLKKGRYGMFWGCGEFPKCSGARGVK